MRIEKLKTIIAGSRHISDPAVVLQAIEQSGYWISEVVSGGAGGVDKLGEEWAWLYQVPLKRFDADWKKNGRAAGPVRNQQMVDYADALIAVWDGKSAGTKDAIRRAKRKGLKVFVFHHPNNNEGETS